MGFLILLVAVVSADTTCGPGHFRTAKIDVEGAGLACNTLRGDTAFYRMENEELKRRFPVPDFTPEQCAKGDVAFFKQAARKMWNEGGLDRKTRTPLQQGVVRNILIGQAFNRIVQLNREKKQPWRPYWAFAAIYADDVVGSVMRQAYGDMARTSATRSQLVATQPEAVAFSENDQTMPLGAMPLIALKLAEGNQRIADETLWQNLAAVRCGPEAVARALEKVPPKDVIGTRSRSA